MNNDDAPPSEGRCHDRPATRPKHGHDKSIAKGAFGAWHTKRNVLFELNEVHGDFRRIFFEHFRALLEETNDEAYVCRLADYVRWILSIDQLVGALCDDRSLSIACTPPSNIEGKEHSRGGVPRRF